MTTTAAQRDLERRMVEDEGEECCRLVKEFVAAHPFPSYEVLYAVLDLPLRAEYSDANHDAAASIYASAFDRDITARLGAEIGRRGGLQAMFAIYNVLHGVAQTAARVAKEQGDPLMEHPLADSEIRGMALVVQHHWNDICGWMA